MASRGHFSAHHQKWRDEQRKIALGVSTTEEPVDKQGLPISWHRKLTPERRNELVVRYLPLAKNIARRLHNHPIYKDLRSAAFEGLLEASREYQPERNGQFPSFAAQRIRWKVGEEFECHARWNGWTVHTHRNRSHFLDSQQRLRNRFKRDPSIDEMAEETDMSSEEVKKALELEDNTSLTSIDAPTLSATDDRPLHETLGDDGLEDIAADRAIGSRIAEAIATVTAESSRRDRHIFHEVIVRGAKHEEAGRAHGVSGEDVTRIVRPLRAALRRELRDLRDR